eukprot:scaffold781_cov222-Chaetoceros_neogracile.AAC.10
MQVIEKLQTRRKSWRTMQLSFLLLGLILFIITTNRSITTYLEPVENHFKPKYANQTNGTGDLLVPVQNNTVRTQTVPSSHKNYY